MQQVYSHHDAAVRDLRLCSDMTVRAAAVAAASTPAAQTIASLAAGTIAGKGQHFFRRACIITANPKDTLALKEFAEAAVTNGVPRENKHSLPYSTLKRMLVCELRTLQQLVRYSRRSCELASRVHQLLLDCPQPRASVPALCEFEQRLVHVLSQWTPAQASRGLTGQWTNRTGQIVFPGVRLRLGSDTEHSVAVSISAALLRPTTWNEVLRPLLLKQPVAETGRVPQVLHTVPQVLHTAPPPPVPPDSSYERPAPAPLPPTPLPPTPCAALVHATVVTALQTMLPANIELIPSRTLCGSHGGWNRCVSLLGRCYVEKDDGLALPFLKHCWNESVTAVHSEAGEPVAAVTFVVVGPRPATYLPVQGGGDVVEDILAVTGISESVLYFTLVLANGKVKGAGRSLVYQVFHAMQHITSPRLMRMLINPPSKSAHLKKLYTSAKWGFKLLRGEYYITEPLPPHTTTLLQPTDTLAGTGIGLSFNVLPRPYGSEPFLKTTPTAFDRMVAEREERARASHLPEAGTKRTRRIAVRGEGVILSVDRHGGARSQSNLVTASRPSYQMEVLLEAATSCESATP